MNSLINVIAKKEFYHIIRDKRTLGLIFILPILQLIVLGYAVSTDTTHIASAVFNQDQHQLSREFIKSLSNSTYFEMKYNVLARSDAEDLMDKGKIKVIFEIPPDFSRKIKRRESSQVGMFIDGSDPNIGTTSLNSAGAVCNAFSEKIRLNKVVLPIDLRPRVYYNPDLRSANFMVPGIIGILLQILIPMLTVSTLVKEKEKGTLEILITTPIKKHELILGKILPYIVLAFVQVVIILFLGSVLFSVKIAGSISLLLFLSFLFLCGSLGIGLFISSIAQNQFQAFQLIMPLMPLSVLLSGFIFPRESMPAALNIIGYFIPLTYFLQILRAIILKGVGFQCFYTEIAALVVYTIFFVFLSIVSFKKHL